MINERRVQIHGEVRGLLPADRVVRIIDFKIREIGRVVELHKTPGKLDRLYSAGIINAREIEVPSVALLRELSVVNRISPALIPPIVAGHNGVRPVAVVRKPRFLNETASAGAVIVLIGQHRYALAVCRLTRFGSCRCRKRHS